VVKLPLALLLVSSLASASSAPERHGRGRVVVTDTTCEILGPINFGANDAQLLPVHQKMIKAVAQTMLGNPSIRLMEVEGYADAGELQPEALGLARATAIMAALVAEGVPMYRLQAGSLGATQPLDKSAQHAERNRRIEFLIIRRDS
jgi:outer membrane protein OmpA-like peptidoglycan-associated protein